jgi:hypothetical protein
VTSGSGLQALGSRLGLKTQDLSPKPQALSRKPQAYLGAMRSAPSMRITSPLIISFSMM